MSTYKDHSDSLSLPYICTLLTLHSYLQYSNTSTLYHLAWEFEKPFIISFIIYASLHSAKDKWTIHLLALSQITNFCLLQDDPEIAFTEDDYRRRRAHPNFKSHISAEKLVVKFGKTNKSKFITYVVASGLTYGAGEEIFHFLFKTAWHGQAPALQCFGNGQNIVPTIHIKDLASVIVNICDQNPKVRYLVAVDESKNTLEEMVKVTG